MPPEYVAKKEKQTKQANPNSPKPASLVPKGMSVLRQLVVGVIGDTDTGRPGECVHGGNGYISFL